MKKLVTLLSLCEQSTAAITRQLPTMTSTLMNASTASETRLVGSVHWTDASRLAHSVSFIALGFAAAGAGAAGAGTGDGGGGDDGDE
uniref:Putative secreted protein n=1 Tax=Anopheles darlingi TaxID=43151 RepID=A0A2M4DFS4_ANODA